MPLDGPAALASRAPRGELSAEPERLRDKLEARSVKSPWSRSLVCEACPGTCPVVANTPEPATTTLACLVAPVLLVQELRRGVVSPWAAAGAACPAWYAAAGRACALDADQGRVFARVAQALPAAAGGDAIDKLPCPSLLVCA